MAVTVVCWCEIEIIDVCQPSCYLNVSIFLSVYMRNRMHESYWELLGSISSKTDLSGACNHAYPACQLLFQENFQGPRTSIFIKMHGKIADSLALHIPVRIDWTRLSVLWHVQQGGPEFARHMPTSFDNHLLPIVMINHCDESRSHIPH